MNRLKDNLSEGEQNALKELSCDNNIVLTKADKGAKTVIMNRTDRWSTKAEFFLVGPSNPEIIGLPTGVGL